MLCLCFSGFNWFYLAVTAVYFLTQFIKVACQVRCLLKYKWCTCVIANVCAHGFANLDYKQSLLSSKVQKKKRQQMWTACRVELWVKLFVHLNLCYMCLHILNFFVTIYFFDLWDGLCWKGGTTCSLGLANYNHTMPVIVQLLNIWYSFFPPSASCSHKFSLPSSS